MYIYHVLQSVHVFSFLFTIIKCIAHTLLISTTYPCSFIEDGPHEIILKTVNMCIIMDLLMKGNKTTDCVDMSCVWCCSVFNMKWYAFLSNCKHLCMSARTHTRMHTHMHTHMLTHIHTHTHTLTYTHAHTHTQTHTLTCSCSLTHIHSCNLQSLFTFDLKHQQIYNTSKYM